MTNSHVLAAILVSNFAVTVPTATALSTSVIPAPSARQEQADLLLRQGIEHYRTGQFAAALGSWQEALSLYRQLQNREGEALILENLGLAYQALGDYEAAIAHHQQHLSLVRELGNRQAEANALGNLGNSYRILGDYTRSLAFHERSLAIRIELQDRLGEGQTLGNLGNVQAELGHYRKAIALHQESLAIARELGDRRAEAISLNSLGMLSASQGDYERASDYYEQCLVLVREIGYVAAEGEILNNLGSIYHVRQDFDRALEYYRQSLAVAQSLGNRRMVGAVLGSLGLVQASLGNYPEAIDNQEKSHALAREIGDRRLAGIALSNLGDTLWQAGNLEAAEEKLRAALDILESLRFDLTDADKVSIFDTQVVTYNILQQVLIAREQPEAALEIAERGRARAFVELLARRLSAQSVAQLRENAPQIDVEPPTVAEIQEIARVQNATLVEYSILPDDRFLVQGKLKGADAKLFIWVIQPTGKITFRQVDLQAEAPASIADLVRTSRILQGPRARRGEAARKQLHQQLIAPIADLLPTDPQARVIFIPQNALFVLPFAALQDASGRYLIEKHTILTAPSIQVLDLTHRQRQRQRREHPEPWQGDELLVVGNPTMPTLKIGDSEAPLAPLPFAEKEAEAIATLFNTQAIIGDRATKAAVLQQLPEARLVHLATHGLLDDIKELGVPGAIALAPSDGDSGFLTPDELLNLKLNAELVVLSACHTGEGTITGDGVMGLSRALIAAGVPSAVVTLRAVPDEPTYWLMSEFYRYLQQDLDKAQALRQAMLSTKERYPQPSNWAVFALVGEP